MSAGLVHEALAQALAQRQLARRVLDAQITGLKRVLALDDLAAADATGGVVNTVLALYLELGSLQAVARVCNAQGWAVRDEAGEPRPFEPEDVELMVVTPMPRDAGGCEALRTLAALARGTVTSAL